MEEVTRGVGKWIEVTIASPVKTVSVCSISWWVLCEEGQIDLRINWHEVKVSHFNDLACDQLHIWWIDTIEQRQVGQDLKTVDEGPKSGNWGLRCVTSRVKYYSDIAS